MDRAYPALRQMFTDIRNLWFEKMGRELRSFSLELSGFLYGLKNHPTEKWHERFHAFAASQRFQGRYMTPESEEALLAYISRWAAMQVAAENAEPVVEVSVDPKAFELTEADKAKAREGLPWWYAKPFELGDGWWQEKFEELANVAGDKMLTTCRELQTLGSLARNVDQLPDDGIDVLQHHVDRVHAAHDEYVQALIDIERYYLSYIKSHAWVGWLVARQIEKLAGKLPPRLFDLPSSKLQTLGRARAEVSHALDKVVKRVDTAYEVAVWTDRAITVLEFATGVFGVAKTVATKAIAKGVAKAIAIRMAVKAGVKQAAIQGAVLVASMYAIPPLLSRAGLNSDFVFAGVVLLQGLTAIQAVRSVQTSNAPPVQDRPPVPLWRQRVEDGNKFNRENASRYPYNEVYVERSGKYVRLDSYNPRIGDIVSRKHSQLARIKESTAVKYLKELARKYPVGAVIASVSSNGALAGQRLQGVLILEVPVQLKPIPNVVLDTAEKLAIQIRDVEGKLY